VDRQRPVLLTAATAVVVFTLALGAYAVWPEGEGRATAWEDLSPRAGPLTITHETKRVFRESRPLAGYLEAVGGRPLRVDFDRRQVLLVSPGPRSSTGYTLDVVSVRERDDKLTVTVRERSPRVSDRVEPRVTFPYRLLSLPAGKDVYVSWPGRSPG
jgi:PrcB C-terminal